MVSGLKTVSFGIPDELDDRLCLILQEYEMEPKRNCLSINFKFLGLFGKLLEYNRTTQHKKFSMNFKKWMIFKVSSQKVVDGAILKWDSLLYTRRSLNLANRDSARFFLIYLEKTMLFLWKIVFLN